MKFLSILTTLGMIFFLSGCETTKPKPASEDRLYRGATFTLRHPPSVTVAVDQGDGYAVHYFKTPNSNVMLGVYEGQRPKIFTKTETDLTIMRRGMTSKENVERGDDNWGIDSKGLIWRESLWNCNRVVRGTNGKTYNLPTMLHLWYFGASEEEQAFYDSLIDTIELNR